MKRSIEQTEPETQIRTIRGIDDDTWQDFKVKCAQERISMGAKLLELIEKYNAGK